MSAGTLAQVGGRRVKLTNLDKVLYPEAGFTKAGVIDYYLRVAGVMLPHMRGRPLSLKRYPDGVEGESFFQKNCPSHKPEWVKTARVRGTQKVTWHCLVEDRAGLAWLGNLAALEVHTYLATTRDLSRPTAMVFDLDPGAPADILDCLRVGVRVRGLLAELGLRCFAKTSGGKGLHIYVPLNTAASFERTKALARELAGALEGDDPKRITSNMRKDLRRGKVFVDWSQNDQNKTTACPYTLRARARPTVSTPVSWEEVEEAARKRRPGLLSFEAPRVIERVEELGDLFEPVLKLRQKPARGAS